MRIHSIIYLDDVGYGVIIDSIWTPTFNIPTPTLFEALKISMVKPILAVLSLSNGHDGYVDRMTHVLKSKQSIMGSLEQNIATLKTSLLKLRAK